MAWHGMDVRARLDRAAAGSHSRGPSAMARTEPGIEFDGAGVPVRRAAADRRLARLGDLSWAFTRYGPYSGIPQVDL